jgi:hypothetical protein
MCPVRNNSNECITISVTLVFIGVRFLCGSWSANAVRFSNRSRYRFQSGFYVLLTVLRAGHRRKCLRFLPQKEKGPHASENSMRKLSTHVYFLSEICFPAEPDTTSDSCANEQRIKVHSVAHESGPNLFLEPLNTCIADRVRFPNTDRIRTGSACLCMDAYRIRYKMYMSGSKNRTGPDRQDSDLNAALFVKTFHSGSLCVIIRRVMVFISRHSVVIKGNNRITWALPS